jgi:hypothetical protein
MSGKKKAVLTLFVGLAVALVGFVGRGAVTNAGGTFVNHQTWHQSLSDGATGVTVDANNGRGATVTLGDYQLAASGVNTKTLVDFDGKGCGNASMSYTTNSDGTYTRTRQTSWNASPSTPYGAQCAYTITDGEPSDFPGDVPNASMWGPNGCHKAFSSGINNGATIADETDCRGKATSKTQWSLLEDYDGNIRYACGYLAPGGAGYWTVSSCSV